MASGISEAYVDGRDRELLRATRNDLVDRLADPYLAKLDRWVLEQLISFCSGVTPRPDLRALQRKRATGR